MDNDFSSHIPFAQLPVEARVLFSILLMTIYGPERPPAEKVLADLEMIWDNEQLALGDFMKPGRIEDVFGKYAAVFRKDVWWLGSIGVSREQAEREGFSSGDGRGARRVRGRRTPPEDNVHLRLSERA